LCRCTNHTEFPADRSINVSVNELTLIHFAIAINFAFAVNFAIVQYAFAVNFAIAQYAFSIFRTRQLGGVDRKFKLN
jgi:hypothetical protein